MVKQYLSVTLIGDGIRDDFRDVYMKFPHLHGKSRSKVVSYVWKQFVKEKVRNQQKSQAVEDGTMGRLFSLVRSGELNVTIAT